MADLTLTPELIELLPQPCALLNAHAVITAVNEAWADMFITTGVGLPLLEASTTLFRWEAADETPVDIELRLLGSGAIDRCLFEAQLAELPERWVVSSLFRHTQGQGAIVWQLSDITVHRFAEQEVAAQLDQICDGLDSLAEGFALFTSEDRLLYANQRYKELIAQRSGAVVPGRTFTDILRMGLRDGIFSEAVKDPEAWLAERLRHHRAAAEQGSEQQLSDGRWLRLVERATSAGGLVTICSDVSELRQAEELRRQSEVQREVIQAQSALLAELSTPLLRISDRVVLAPLVGSIDSHRAERVVEGLLEAVVETRVGLAILDITGVPIVDTQVANVLLQCGRAVRLLGAQLIITGIRPDVAQTIVALGIDLSEIITQADLQAGISYALRR